MAADEPRRFGRRVSAAGLAPSVPPAAVPSGEDDFIARHFRPIAGPGALDLLDDAACIAPPAGRDLILTKDALVAGVHFFPDDPPASIARKAIRVNLSDLAAKGAKPLGVLLAIALPADHRDDWVGRFARGLAEDCATYAAPLLGGDTVRTPGPLAISITALGTVPRRGMVPRTGAKPGHILVVTGTIGDAALGLQVRADPDVAWAEAVGRDGLAFLLDRYLHPQPRLALADALRAHASAAMDVSDGLVGDAFKMLRASGVGGTLVADAVPLSPAAAAAVAAAPELRERALTGGDDYEILAAMPDAAVDGFADAAAALGVAVARIGVVGTAEMPLALVDAAGEDVVLAGAASFSHFGT